VSEDEDQQYAVKISDAADKQFKKLEKQQQRQILLKLDKLKAEPRPSGVVKLSGYQNLWRIRAGDYRIVYEIHDGELLVLVMDIDHRSRVYRDL
jgi:mRNA interferase RelE/StbE